MSSQDLEGAHARIDRLEARVESQQTKIAAVAEDTAFIRGYLQENGNGPKRRPVRDSALVAGGGGVVGAIVVIVEYLITRGGTP